MTVPKTLAVFDEAIYAREFVTPVPAKPVVIKAKWGARLRKIPWLSLIIVAVLVGWGTVPALFTHFDPAISETALKLTPPSLHNWWGTDHLGRDVYARVVYGARSTVLSALLAVSIGLTVGSALGLVSGYLGGVVDAVVGGFLEVLLAIPSLLLALIFVATFGYDTTNTSIAVGISSIALFARLMRSEVLWVKSQAFVEAARVSGAKSLVVLVSHILPNAFSGVFAIAVTQFGVAILAIASLAFLGYGSPPPASDWGLLISHGRDYLMSAPWIVVIPSAAIIVTVLAVNRIAAFLKGAR